MPKYITLILLSFTIIFCISCNFYNEDRRSLRKEIKSITGTEVKIPDNIIGLNFNNPEQKQSYYDATNKIFFYIDSISCNECVMKTLYEWESFLNNSTYDWKLFIIISSGDYILIDKMFKDYYIDIPFFWDSNNSFESHNQFIKKSLFQTFLTIDDKVVVIGNPIVSTKVRKQYEKHVRNYK